MCLHSHDMYVEAFHHVIKYKFLKSRKNKRIDTLIHKLFEYLQFKSYDRLIKVEKGKITGRIALIKKRHSNSLSMSSNMVLKVNSVTWEVQSENGLSKYIIEKVLDECSDH